MMHKQFEITLKGKSQEKQNKGEKNNNRQTHKTQLQSINDPVSFTQRKRTREEQREKRASRASLLREGARELKEWSQRGAITHNRLDMFNVLRYLLSKRTCTKPSSH